MEVSLTPRNAMVVLRSVPAKLVLSMAAVCKLKLAYGSNEHDYKSKAKSNHRFSDGFCLNKIA
eukprot:1138304-Amphidinium_carterae.1